MERIVDRTWYRTDVFEPVAEVPFGYYVWAIGRENFQHERCVPLARDGKEKNHIDPRKLKYIKVESEKIALRLLREAVEHGCDRDRFYKIIQEEETSTMS